MDDDLITHVCAQCGETFTKKRNAKGQAYSWCAPCRKAYMVAWWESHPEKKPLGLHGPPAPPIHGPEQPKGKWIACSVCGTVVSGRSSLCGASDCAAENSRRNSRIRRQVKPASHVKNKRQSDRNRRMRKRGNTSEPYDPIVIADRDGWRCSLCRKAISRTKAHPHPSALTMDHVIPVSEGGDDAPHNVRACHSLCNSVKGNRVHGDGEQLMLVG